MKKVLIWTGIVVFLLGVASIFVLRFPPWQIGAAVKVATGLGAKLACSGRFISGFSQQQISDDLASYSPATRLLEYQVDEEQKAITTTLWGMNATTAVFRDNLGCSLAFGDTQSIEQVSLPATKLTRRDRPWPEGDSVETVDISVQQTLERLLQEDNQDGLDTRALAVVKDGNIIAEAYAPGYDSDSSLLGWSMGKTITAMLIGNLIAQNRLGLDDAQLFPQWNQDERANITVKHLLTMTSGLDFDETYLPGTDSTRMLFSSHSASDVALASALEHQPGYHFSYSSGTTNILARLAYETTGGTAQKHYEHLHQALIQPLNLTSFVFEPDASGVLVGSSYIYASARDWAKLGQLILNGGQLNGHAVFTPDFAQALSQPNSSNNDKRYGYQTWLNSGDAELRWDQLPADAFAMRGNRAQIVLVIPSVNAVIVRLGWTSGWYSVNDKFSTLVDLL